MDATTNTKPAAWLTPEFRDRCKAASVEPTRRQLSKVRNGYGALARYEGTSTRQKPPGMWNPNVTK